MAFPDEYIESLQDQISEYRAQLRPLEDGTMHIGERKFGGDWTDKTQSWIADLKRYIAVLEGIIAKLRSGEPI